MILIPRDVCVDIDQAIGKEWLVANGIGGYASSTIAGINTRRYHGLLVAALEPPVARTVLLANINEEAEIDGRTYYIAANEYAGERIHPAGFVHIEEFALRNGIPSTLYRLGDNLLRRTVWMEHGHNTTYVRYSYLEGTEECCLVLHPLCNYRDYHEITKGVFDWDFGVDTIPGGCKITAHSGADPFWIYVSPHAEFTHTGVWYWNFVYRREVERGYTDKEDLYLPGVVRLVLQPGEEVTLVASTEPPEESAQLLDGALEREEARQTKLLSRANVSLEAGEEDAAAPDASKEAFVAQLVQAADTFIVKRTIEEDGSPTAVPTVIAGYHWFTDWGRDTMIALPGLLLPTGRAAEAEEVLRAFARFFHDGLLPNNFPDAGSKITPEYNTVDATLWMFVALERLWEATGKPQVAVDLYPLLVEVIEHHLRGTHYGIGVDPQDGLLRAGEEGVQLTWMDAKVGDWVATPRIGKPVEINALWIAALRLMEKLRSKNKSRKKSKVPDFDALAKQAEVSFRERFWYGGGAYLYDVIDGPDGDDASLRPNQLIALAVPDLLSHDQARLALSAVREQLFTPYGLRTLPPDDQRYFGVYEGTRRERDAAYHNGTVWAWLLGPYFDTVANIEGEDAASAEFNALLPQLRPHLADAGLGTISEIFDANSPHAPRGCISQAWSVAEILRWAVR